MKEEELIDKLKLSVAELYLEKTSLELQLKDADKTITYWVNKFSDLQKEYENLRIKPKEVPDVN